MPSVATPLTPGTPVTLGTSSATQTAAVSIDRTVSGGLNAAPSTTTVTVTIEASSDGVHYTPVASCVLVGGTIADNPDPGAGSPVLLASLPPGTISTKVVATASAAVSVTPTVGAA